MARREPYSHLGRGGRDAENIIPGTENHAAAYAERAATAHSVLPQFAALAAQTQAFHQAFVTLLSFLRK